MDIVLQTNTDNPSLAFRSLERFEDDSGYAAILEVRSGWISVSYRFVFEPHPLLEFLAHLEQIDRTLSGVARLKPMYEDQFVEFQGYPLGHVVVKGELVDYDGLEQRVRFQFLTDQTCLRPLVSAFRKIAK